MTKHKGSGKDKKKGSQLVIRIDKTERDAFVALCDRLDTSAAREIRRFMREQVAAHATAAPADETAVDATVIADADIAMTAPLEPSTGSPEELVVPSSDDVKTARKKKK